MGVALPLGLDEAVPELVCLGPCVPMLHSHQIRFFAKINSTPFERRIIKERGIAEVRLADVVALKGDWTNQDPNITAELAKYHRSAVPFNVIWLPGKKDPVLLPELPTPGIVLDTLKG